MYILKHIWIFFSSGIPHITRSLHATCFSQHNICNVGGWLFILSFSWLLCAVGTNF